MKILANIATLGISRPELMKPVNNIEIMAKIKKSLILDGWTDKDAPLPMVTNVILGAYRPNVITDKAVCWNMDIRDVLQQAMIEYEKKPTEKNRTAVELRCQDFTNRWTPKSGFAVRMPIYADNADDPPYMGTKTHVRLIRDAAHDVMNNTDAWIYFEWGEN